MRKKGKLPADTFSQDFVVEYGKATIEVHKDSINKNDSVLIIDDLIATGGTAEAAAKTYAIKIKAEADAKQTRLIAEAIKNDGQPAINFEIMKRQVDGLSELASSNQTKTLIVPSDITKALGTIELLLGSVSKDEKSDA